MQAMKTQGVLLLLLLLLCAVSTCWGQQVICLSLTPPTNGVISYSDPTLGDGTVATYACNTGYTLSGVSSTTRTCGSDGVWSGFAPNCQPDCPDLPSLNNGMIMYSAGFPDNRPFISTATHSCNTGYTLTGGTTRTCLNGGSWDGSPPTCQGACFDLPPLMNGGITYTDGLVDSRPINTIATFTCDNGYTLTGGGFRACQNDRTWSGTTQTCQLTTEPPTTCPDLTVPANGVISYNMGTRPVDTVATHTCDTGYTLDGGSTRTCGSDGVWSGSALTCQATCPDLTVPANGMISYTPTSIPRLQGTVATHSCDEGYRLSGGIERMCQSDRTWSGVIITCQQLLPVYVSLGFTNYAAMNSQVAIDTIGETDDEALICKTDNARCCRGSDGLAAGEWRFPNGDVVPRRADFDTSVPFVSSRDTGALRLHRRGSVSGPTGSYCCVIPDNTGVDVTFCVQLVTGVITVITTSPPTATSTDESCLCQCPQSDSTGAVVGGVVALVAVIAVTVVMVTYLVLRYKRGGKMTVPRDISLTDQGQSAAATYETVPATYEEIPASREVKGDYSYTQNNAYSTVSGREAPAAEGIYDN